MRTSVTVSKDTLDLIHRVQIRLIAQNEYYYTVDMAVRAIASQWLQECDQNHKKVNDDKFLRDNLGLRE